MKNKNVFLLLIVGMLVCFACKKDDAVSDGTGAVEIISLTAIDTVLNAWQTTTVNAVAQGDGLIYNWEADHGEINGHGEQIEYMAGTCCTGINTITCKVSNSQNSDVKQIKLRILPF